MTKKTFLCVATLMLLLASPVVAQKPPDAELGFRPGRLYDSHEIDSINLFNGTLSFNIPIGMRYHVSPTLSYQLNLIYSSRPREDRSWSCDNFQGQCGETYAERGSNAGLGWRLSLGELVPPMGGRGNWDTFEHPDTWIYISPSGAEYELPKTFNPVWTGYRQDFVRPGVRMHLVDGMRDIEFPSGEIHRFKEFDDDVWRVISIRDRKSTTGPNWVKIDYDPDEGGYVTTWNITDSSGRKHRIEFESYAHANLRSAGMQVARAYFESPLGPYEFEHVRASSRGCAGDRWKDLAILQALKLPDGSKYTFTYGGETCLPWVTGVQLPTGGRLDYEFMLYNIGNTDACNYMTPLTSPGGVVKRKVTDGVNPVQEWKYLQVMGPRLEIDYHDNSTPCGLDLTMGSPVPPPGPAYWSRTSVLSPAGSDGKHTRTDHYFNILANDYWPGSTVTKPFGPADDPGFGYGYPGAFGMPGDAEKITPTTSDVDGRDGNRRITSQVYSGCASNGDCPAANLLRSTYQEDEDRLLKSQKVVFHDETATCTGGKCYTLLTNEDFDGLHHYRKVINESSLPDSKKRTTFTGYKTWGSDANAGATWINTSLFDEKWVEEEGGEKAREQFVFNATTGFLERHRVLAGAAPGTTDVLKIFTIDSEAVGNAETISIYGGEDPLRPEQRLSTASDLASVTPPANPEFKIKNTYTLHALSLEPVKHRTPFLATSEYLNPATGVSLGVLHVDRTINPITGAVMEDRDTAGAATEYTYDFLANRLERITSPRGSSTSIDYERATGQDASDRPSARLRTWPTGSYKSGTPLTDQYFYYDLLGRLIQQRVRMPGEEPTTEKPNPAEVWSVTDTRYDSLGHEASRTSATLGTSGAYSALPSNTSATVMTYDALDRPLTTTLPDGSVSEARYKGITRKWRLAKVRTTPETEIAVWTAEEYDWLGRLVKITENAPDPALPERDANNEPQKPAQGTAIATTYAYDIAGRLVTVTSGTQTRTFNYDLAGRLNSDDHPESDATTYVYDSLGNAVTRTTAGKKLTFLFDRASRLETIAESLTADTSALLKKFEYGDSVADTNRNRGKVKTAIRYNPYQGHADEIAVTETFTYGTSKGLLSLKKTTAGSETFEDQYTYDILGNLSTVTYPTCANGCTAPSRVVTNDYDQGLLEKISHKENTVDSDIADLTYHLNGMVNTVAHKDVTGLLDGPVQTQTIASHGMPRPASITVSGYCTDLVINEHPLSQTKLSGSVVPLSVTMQGNAATSWQWYEGTGTKIDTATTASYSPTVNSTTSFWVRVGNGTCTVDSRPAIITVPTTGCGVITSQPPATTEIPAGTSATLTMGVTANAIVEWYGGTPENPGPKVFTGADFTTPVLHAPKTYWCRVTAADGSCAKDSITFNVNVVPCPTFTIQSSVSTVPANTSFRLTATPYSGATYKWYSGPQSPSATLLGTTSVPSFDITAITAPTQYWAEVTAPCFAVATKSTPITVNFCGAPAMRTITAVVQATGVQLSVPDDNDGVTFEWFQGSSYTNTSQPAGTGPSIVVPLTGGIRSYWVRMTRTCGSLTPQTNTDFILVDPACAPTIFVQPVPVSKAMPASGLSVSMTATVVAGPRGPFTYKWYVDDTEIEGAGAESYTWTYTSDDTRDYVQKVVKVGVTACGATVTSDPVTLTATKTPQKISAYKPMSVLHSINAVKLFVSMDPDPPGHTYTYEWYRDNGTAGGEKLAGTGSEKNVEPTTIGTYWAKVKGTHDSARNGTYTDYSVSKKMYVYQSDACELPALRVTQNYGAIPSGSPTVVFQALLDWPGVAFQWYSGVAGDTRHPVTADPDKPNQFSVSSAQLAPYWVRAKLACGAQQDSDTLYYTRGNCGPVIIDPNIASIDVAYGGNAALSVTPIAAPAASYDWYREGNTPPEFVGSGATYNLTNVTASGRYFVKVENDACSTAFPSNSYTAAVRVKSCPSLTPPTWPNTVFWADKGTTATLSAQTGGATSYKWFRGEVGDTSQEIGGATLPTYTTDAINADAKFWVRASNSNCIVDSPTLTVKMCEKPEPNETPWVDYTIAPGQAQLLTISMKGTNLEYQWYVGERLNTASPFGRRIDNIQVMPSVTTRYWVRVTAHCGTGEGSTRVYDSPTFTVSVCPRITTEPVAAKPVVMPGTTTTLEIVAAGADSYKWYIGQPGVTTNPIANSNSARITTPALTQQTTFWCEIKSGNCPVYSQPVVVDICGASTAYWNAHQTKVEKNHFQVLALHGVPDVDRTFAWYEGPLGNTSTPLSDQAALGISPTATTSYWLRVTFTETGCYVQAGTTVEVCVPKITTHPQSAMINSGTSRVLTVGADLTNVTYQWYTGASGNTSAPIAGQVGSSITVSPTTATSYWARVTGSCSIYRDSNAAQITICQLPTISEQPYSINVTATASANLSVTAAGSSPTYQWYKGVPPDVSTPLANKTTAAISFIAGSTADYWVKVTTACGSINSAPAKVSVPPTINSFTFPGSAWVMPGGTKELTVNASGNQLRYEWYKRAGGTATIITGATAPSYITPPITVDTSYFCRVYSGTHPLDTADASFTVCQPPTLGWGSILTQTGPNRVQTITVTGISAETPVTYQWYEGAAGVTTKPLGTGPSLGIQPAVTTSYWVKVTYTDTGCTANSATLTISVCIPTITTNPPATSLLDKVSNPSAYVALTVAADISAVTYQWYTGQPGNTSAPISGATAATYNASPSSDTTYWARVTSSCAATRDSTAAQVILCKAPAISAQPISFNHAATATANISVTASGSNLTYQWYKGVAPDTTTPFTGKTTAAISFVAGSTSDYWVKVSGTCGSVNSTSAKISVPPTINSFTAGSWVMPGATKALSVSASGNQLRYEWYKRVNGTVSLIAGQTGPSYTTPAINSDTAFFCRVFSGTYPLETADALFTVCQPPALGWGTFIPQTGPNRYQTLSVTGIAAETPVTYQWYEGSAGTTTKPLGSGPTLGVQPLVTTSYWVKVTYTSTGCTADSSTLTISVCVPTITTNPPATTTIDKVSNPSAYARLTVAADISNVTYQWYIGQPGTTTSPVSGATGSTYDASPNSDTTYWARVSGSCASKDSTAAQVILCRAPAITSQPVSVETTANVVKTLSVAATGTNLGYMWYRGTSGDLSNPHGGTTASINVQSSVTTDYWVKVYGLCGTVYSHTAKVSIPPGITTQPAGASVTKGATQVLSVVASGTQLAYQWHQRNPDGNATLLAGQTAASFTTPALHANASYFCKVSSGTAFVYTVDAVLTVCQPNTIAMTAYNNVSGSATSLYVADMAGGGETYQWYRGASGNTSVSAGNGNGIAIAPLETTQYWLRTTRGTCYADTPTYTVYVCKPNITTQPVGGMVAAGSTKSLTVVATGTAPLTYQWYLGARGTTTNPIGGQTAATYSFQPTGTGTYWCRITSPATGCGISHTDSEAVVVTVCQPPVITRHPQPTSVTNTAMAYLDVAATGDGLVYQWFEGVSGVTTTPIGTNSNQISFRPGDTKSYWVRVSGTCGTVNSNTVKVSVVPTITSPPVQGKICALGESATFSVTATGSELTYQWYRQYNGGTQQLVGTTQSIAIPITSVPAYITCLVKSGDAGQWAPQVDVELKSKPDLEAGTSGANGGWYRLKAYLPEEQYELVGSYKFYEGLLGDTSKLLYSGTWYEHDVYVPVRPKTFWIRATYTSTGCYKDAAVTIN